MENAWSTGVVIQGHDFPLRKSWKKKKKIAVDDEGTLFFQATQASHVLGVR